jgi:aminoglycoside phosphotransferase (APT) family kinase protein
VRSAAQWARPVLRDGFTGWLRRAERRWTAAVAPRLVAGVTAAGDAGWRTEALAFTSTSVAVATVTRPGATRSFVVKVPWTAEGAEGLRRQAAVLAMLRRDSRLPSLRPVLPRCVGQGEVEGRYYCVEEALPGVPANAIMLRRTGRAALLGAATRVIGDLHARTREQTLLGGAAVEAWVDAPVRRLEAFAATRPQRDRLLDAVWRLREELTATLVGRTVSTSWIHGDFWPGNLLAAPPGAQVTGVVDWDRAAARQLPLHDLLHLHVLARRLARGDELGDVVIRALRQGIDEALGVPAGEVAAWLDGIPQRPALLLYWLRHILLFIDSEGDHDNPRWLRGNVERVLVNV